MDEIQELRQKIVADFNSIFLGIANLRISQVFEYKDGFFQLPETTPVPKQLSSDKHCGFYIMLLVLVVEKIGNCVKFDFENDKITVDCNAAIKSLEFDEYDLETLKNAARNAALLRETLEERGGIELFLALIFSYQKHGNFRHSDLYSKIMCSVIGGTLEKRKVTL